MDGGETTACGLVQSFDGTSTSDSKSGVRFMPNLSPNILRADTAPPIGTSITRVMDQTLDCSDRKKQDSDVLFPFQAPGQF